MNAMETALSNRILDEQELTKKCDDLLTKALEALEKYNYDEATILARTCLDTTPWIEQKMACVSLLTTAATRNKKATINYLKMIYQP